MTNTIETVTDRKAAAMAANKQIAARDKHIADMTARCYALEGALYNIGMDLEAMGLNTSDVEAALGGKDGIKRIESRIKEQEG
jgi:hypothetical protein